MELWPILRDIVFLLAASLLCGGLVSRWGQSPIIGYLLAGMFLGGPGSLGVIESPEKIEAIAELGVALLLFSLGLEFSLERLKKLGPRPLWGGVLQVVATMVIGALVTWVTGVPLRGALAFGAMIALSSTAVVLRMLMERSELEMPHGRNCLAVLLTQDMAVVPLAFLITILGGQGDAAGLAGDALWLLVMAAVLFFGLFLLNKVAIFALGTLTMLRHRELTVIMAVVTGLGAAWASHAVDVSPALGAFVAGMLLGASPFATQIRADVSSLRVLLLTLFFSAAGMVANPLWMAQNWWLVLSCTLVLTVGKFAIVFGIFRWLGQTTRVSAATGLCLAQIGEFAFVLGTIGRANEVVSADLYSLVISSTIASFFLSALLVPAAVGFGNRFAGWLRAESLESESQQSSERGTDVLLVGFGPAGQAAAAPLLDRDLRVEVIDLNRGNVQRAMEMGFHGSLGDATQFEVLEHADVDRAQAIVITVPHFHSALAILDNVRQQAPHAFVLVRSRYKMHSDDFASRGVVVVGDEEQVGDQLSRQLADWLQQFEAARQASGDADADGKP